MDQKFLSGPKNLVKTVNGPRTDGQGRLLRTPSGEHEAQKMKIMTRPELQLWNRFMDGGFGIWRKSRRSFKQRNKQE